MDPVRSRRNPRVVEALKLHRPRYRRKTNQILVEGPHLLAAALAAGADPRIVFCLEHDETTRQAQQQGARVVEVTDEVMESLADSQHPRGPVAVFTRPPNARVASDLVMVCWDLQDPGNVGTLIRTAAALGMGVVVSGSSADPWSPKVIRAAAGGHFATAVEEVAEASLELLSDRGYATVACLASGGIPPDALPKGRPTAIIVGNESAGLPSSVTDKADWRVSIPMTAQVESLNVSVAGAIVAYELVRQPPSAGDKPGKPAGPRD